MTECPICLEIISEDNIILLQCCQMKFCSSCISTWFNTTNNPSCPICHKDINNYYIPIADVVENVIENVIENDNQVEIMSTIKSYFKTKLCCLVLGVFILMKLCESLDNQ